MRLNLPWHNRKLQKKNIFTSQNNLITSTACIFSTTSISLQSNPYNSRLAYKSRANFQNRTASAQTTQSRSHTNYNCPVYHFSPSSTARHCHPDTNPALSHPPHTAARFQFVHALDYKWVRILCCSSLEPNFHLILNTIFC